ncbi:MAG: putative sugar O-methyltransferase [Elusimicrobiota bacterium]
MRTIHEQVTGLFRLRDRLLAQAAGDPGIGLSDFNHRIFAPMAYLYENYPKVMANLRHHCYHFTGLTYNMYTANALTPPQRFVDDYLRLIDGLPIGLVIRPPEILGEFGYEIAGNLVNRDTVRYQEMIRFLWEAGVLEPAGNDRNQTILEIGAGWGALAHHLSHIFGEHTTYIIIDIPEALYISAHYLSAANPDKKLWIYDAATAGTLQDAPRWRQYDFILMPNFKLAELSGLNFDLVINTISFQEMSAAQVEGYLDFIKTRLKGSLFSFNKERTESNLEELAVNTLIEERFDIVRRKIYSKAPPGGLPGRLLRELYHLLIPRKRWPFDHQALLARSK